MPVIPGTRAAVEGADQGGMIKTARGDYDFAVDAGAIGDINLMGLAAIPDNAILVGGFLEVETALTSGGAATAALKVEAANDIVAAAVISGAPWSTTGRKDVIPDMTGSTAVKATAARDIVLSIATAALTAGKFAVVLYYLEPLP